MNSDILNDPYLLELNLENIKNDNNNHNINFDIDNRQLESKINFNKGIKNISFKLEKYQIKNKQNSEMYNRTKNLTSSILLENTIFDINLNSKQIKNKENLYLNSLIKSNKDNILDYDIKEKISLLEEEFIKNEINLLNEYFNLSNIDNFALENENTENKNPYNLANFSNFKTSKFHVINVNDINKDKNELIDKSKNQSKSDLENSISVNSTQDFILEKTENIHNYDLFLYFKKFPEKKNAYVLNLIESYKINFSNNIIDLSNINIGSTEIELISNYLKNNPEKLLCSKLQLCSRNLSQKTIQNLSSFCSHNNCLKFLDLSGCQIGDIGCRHFCEAFYINKNIEEINLQMNNIGDYGAEILSDFISSNQSITKLELEHNFIGNKGALKLYDAIRKNLKIKWVNLFGNNCINNNLIFKISSQLKNNRISSHSKKTNTLKKII